MAEISSAIASLLKGIRLKSEAKDAGDEDATASEAVPVRVIQFHNIYHTHTIHNIYHII